MTLAPIIRYWDSERVPADVGALLRTFEQRNPERAHLVFDKRAAAEFIGARLGERYAAAFATCAVPAMQADYFRYCAVQMLGGIYVDADFRCLASLGTLFDGPHNGVLFGRPELPARWRTPAFEWRERVGEFRGIINSFFAFRSAGHPLPGLAMEIATANIESRVEEDVALVTGPAIFTSLYLLRELGSFDAFLAYAEGGALERSSRQLCEIVAEYERIPGAFAGVELRPVAETYELVADERELEYKRDERHWTNVTASIYR